MGERDFFMEKGLTGFTKWIPDSYFSSWQIDIVKGVAVHQSGGMLFSRDIPESQLSRLLLRRFRMI